MAVTDVLEGYLMRLHRSKAHFKPPTKFAATSVRKFASKLLVMVIFNFSNIPRNTVVGFIL